MWKSMAQLSEELTNKYQGFNVEITDFDEDECFHVEVRFDMFNECLVKCVTYTFIESWETVTGKDMYVILEAVVDNLVDILQGSAEENPSCLNREMVLGKKKGE